MISVLPAFALQGQQRGMFRGTFQEGLLLNLSKQGTTEFLLQRQKLLLRMNGSPMRGAKQLAGGAAHCLGVAPPSKGG